MEASISSSTAFYARIIQVSDTGDEASRKSLKEELLKIIEEQNDESKAKVVDKNDNVVDLLQDASQEEPPLKKKKSDQAEELFAEYKQDKTGCRTEFVAKHYREDIGEAQLGFKHPEKFCEAGFADEVDAYRKEVGQLDFMSSKPWCLEKLRPGVR